ncbi:Cna B-type domain-containing protein [Catenisphaera adipataccumulans]|uniref:Putative RNA-binding protein with TRAM domain n=1 Tax=Catenisphaera adipataccumulans TaxID=700500 RepID=A0A7W8CY44_9FIRM|nr:Cna B-type domain-containing protein [Catenisphaera adipataccumulans]MBB5182090.1 putative RNA-binding protein with TRAM domain [Catenisphaera adipataccumulans]
MKKHHNKGMSWVLRVLMAWILALSLCVPTMQSAASAESSSDPSESTTEVTETQTTSETNDETETTSGSSDETQTTSESNNETKTTEDPSADSSESDPTQSTSDSTAAADSKEVQTTVLTTSDQITLKASYVSEDGKVSDTGTFILLFKDKNKQPLSNSAEKVDGYTLSDITLEDGTAVTDVVRKKDKNDKAYYEAVDDSGTVRAQLTENETIVFHYQASAKPKRSAAKLNQTTSYSITKTIDSYSTRASIRRAKKSMNAENVTMQLYYIDASGNEKSVSQLQSTKNSRLRKAAKKADTSAVTLKEVMSNGGTYQWDDLPKYDADGNEIQYTAREVGAEKIGYQPTYQKAMINGVWGSKITNTPMLNITVGKNWANGASGRSVTVDLLRNGTNIKSLTLSADNGWTGSFGYQMPYDIDTGETYEYTIEEKTDGHYETTVTGSAERGFTISNSPSTEQVTIPITKKWENNNVGSDVTIKLLSSTDGKEWTDTGKMITLDGKTDETEAEAWKASFKANKYGKDGKELKYKVSEENTGYDTTITGSTEEGFTITNTAVEVKVNKQWAGGASGDFVTVDLLQNGKKTGDQVTLNENNNWEATFEGLKKYDENGDEYKYTVAEKNEEYDTEITGSVKDGFIISNSPSTEQVTIPITKKWENDNVGSAVTIKLLSSTDGEEWTDTGKTITLDGKTDETETEAWKAVFKANKYGKDGKELKYKVSEETTGYDTTITGSTEEGFTITNTGLTISVNKIWADGATGDSVTVDLLQNGKKIDKLTLNEDNNWEASFKGLKKYDKNGDEYEYTVAEENEEYDSEITGSVEDGFTITNAPSTKQVTIPVVKKWKGGKSRAAVTIKLLSSTDGKEWADTGKTITLDGKTDETETKAWKASFKANKYSEDGKEMKYKVTEENGDEYNASYDGNMNDGFTITNTSPADPEQKTDTKKTNKPKAKKNKAAVPKTGVAMPILADLVLMMAAVLAVITIRRKRISK